MVRPMRHTPTARRPGAALAKVFGVALLPFLAACAGTGAMPQGTCSNSSWDEQRGVCVMSPGFTCCCDHESGRCATVPCGEPCPGAGQGPEWAPPAGEDGPVVDCEAIGSRSALPPSGPPSTSRASQP